MKDLPLTPDEVEERARRFQELLGRERELQEGLVALQIRGDRARVRQLIKLHDDALAEINKIRMEGIVPIVAELVAYVRAVREKEARENGG